MHLSRIAALILLTTLVGCSDAPPYGFPNVDADARLADDIDCPNLDGTYQFLGDTSGHFGLNITALGADEETRWSSVTVTTDANGALLYTRRMDKQTVQNLAMSLRDYDDQKYERWRLTAIAGPDLSGPDISRALQDYYSKLGSNGPTPERSGQETSVQCQDGWLGIPLRGRYEADDEGTRIRDDTVWLARDTQNGLLARALVGKYYEFPIWCGDGCKGIPYYTNSRTAWARFAPSQSPPTWHADAATLPPSRASIAAAANLERQREAARPKPPQLKVLATPDPRAPEFKLRVQALLRGSAVLTWYAEEPRFIHVGAVVDKEEDARRLMADLRNDREVAGLEFLSIGPTDQKRTRINVGVYLKPRP